VFDPFRDFDVAGYLRNFEREKDLEIVRAAEHDIFRANLPDAVRYLKRQKKLIYRHFLHVHHILFKGFYPWAGKDRAETAPECLINKGETYFSHPFSTELAVNEGLRLGQDSKTMRARPGEIMGLFAYGHPFLDGNGRTMLLVHAELCRRAGFSILWQATCKDDYLRALTDEIRSPGKGILDRYLREFIGPVQNGGQWLSTAAMLPGLDGIRPKDEIAGDLSDPAVVAEYVQFEKQRAYAIKK
jgi:cell filamentation protein